jgi:hypothetical protein
MSTNANRHGEYDIRFDISFTDDSEDYMVHSFSEVGAATDSPSESLPGSKDPDLCDVDNAEVFARVAGLDLVAPDPEPVRLGERR